MPNFLTISAKELENLDPNKGIILDVRTEMEHAEKHLSFGHALVPLDQLKPTEFMMRHGLDKHSAVYILCRSGKRATKAAEQFTVEGYQNVHVIKGGIIACEDCGHKVEGHGAKSSAAGSKAFGHISLERQVRITAGLIVTVGAALALAVSSYMAVIPLFVGCGLVFSGITDRCGMALILTKAPWNKKVSDSSCSLNPVKTRETGQSCQ